MIKRKIVSRRADGVELVRGSFGWDEKAELLAAPWIENTLRWLDTELLPRAKQAFEADPAPDKRFFFHRYDYALSITLNETSAHEAILTVKATLSRGALLQEASRGERVRLADLAFLPPQKTKKAPRRVPSSASAE